MQLQPAVALVSQRAVQGSRRRERGGAPLWRGRAFVRRGDVFLGGRRRSNLHLDRGRGPVQGAGDASDLSPLPGGAGLHLGCAKFEFFLMAER